MLATLRIRNIALVEDLTLELEPGYTAMTGETGAGKSVIIGALSLLLGERADRTLIRSGSDTCSVEAVFDISRVRQPIPDYLESHGLDPCEGTQLVLKRTLTGSGQNRQYVNGSPTSVQTLAELGDWLVDLHGPHEHQSLLRTARQLELLDAYGGLEALRDEFRGLVGARREWIARKEALVLDEAAYGQQLDLLRHQVQEIEAARLQPEEEERLPLEHQRASNAVALLDLSQSALNRLTEDEDSLINQAGALGRMLQELRRLDPRTECLGSLHDQALSFWRDLLSDLRRYSDSIDVDPERLRQLEERLNLLQSLQRKYGATVDAVIEFGAQARARLDQLEGRDAEVARLNHEIRRIESELNRVGSELTTRRRKTIPRLKAEVTRELSGLGFGPCRFEIELTTATPDLSVREAYPTVSGLDRIEFQFSPNAGEPPRPLSAIASSGEIARAMLALKAVLAAQDQVPLLIFDEVDANVGGETGNAVGERMRSIGAQRQVLCITHLANVAARAAQHLVVTKAVRGGRTLTDIRPLDHEARVLELARMLGGVSETARRHAAALLKS